MSEKKQYAIEWNCSAQFFYDNNSYKHLSLQIEDYTTVLEIGCGTGQSTLALLQNGHRVIAVEHNSHCLDIAMQLIRKKGFKICETLEDLTTGSVYFINYDITHPQFLEEVLPILPIDIVVCWNIGTYWDEAMMNHSFPKMLDYGLTDEQIRANPESSYSELIIWTACALAKRKPCAVHIVDRSTQKLTRFNDPYYKLLKKEFGFREIKYKNIKSKSLSQGGRILVIEGKRKAQTVIPIIFISVLMK